ncbi:hypothetical protein FB566_5009 [Stackebrandtia endophytica]|uniref:Uncharacterized protein n=1 Tax=Stackebrandtia endophytica TaxID=1496996 RepID=A0A543B3K5_9ACTN|nr:hypothetical protein [Stackebrandtia endophytica]TQL79404.1 hypothetical protein FB566_5009 [Stackebrandtia endophytica]
MNEASRWERPFRIEHYTISRGTLVLRSLMADGRDTRVEIGFVGVRRISLPTNFDRVEITRKSLTDPALLAALEPWSNEDLAYFAFQNDGDYVVATGFSCVEDYGDSRAKSRFGPLPGLW